MCHGASESNELRDSLRMAGIKGLQGVIRSEYIYRFFQLSSYDCVKVFFSFEFMF
jgi:hypothetical protein